MKVLFLFSHVTLFSNKQGTIYLFIYLLIYYY
jgi:hypothetical protein